MLTHEGVEIILRLVIEIDNLILIQMVFMKYPKKFNLEGFETALMQANVSLLKSGQQVEPVFTVVLRAGRPVTGRFGQYAGKRIDKAKVCHLIYLYKDNGQIKLGINNPTGIHCSLDDWHLESELIRAQQAMNHSCPYLIPPYVEAYLLTPVGDRSRSRYTEDALMWIKDMFHQLTLLKNAAYAAQARQAYHRLITDPLTLVA